MNFPAGLHYTKSHEWIDPKTGNIGLTDFAQDQLGDVIYLDFAVEVGEEIKAGHTLGTVESVKTVSDAYSPVAGKVVALNQSIVDSPENVNQSPYKDGWMFRIEITDVSKLSELMDAEAYQKHIGT